MKSTRRSLLAPLFTVALFSIAVAATPQAVKPLPDDPAATAQDKALMKRANELAAATAKKGNSSYGALIIDESGKILMEFGNDARTSGDTTHHAETGLISLASRRLGREVLANSILYTSTEPCIMCCGAIRSAGFKKFVYGVTAVQVTRLRGNPVPPKPLECREVFARTNRAGSPEVVIVGPVLEAEGLAVHAAAMTNTVAATK